MIVNSAPSLGEAVIAFLRSVDEHNSDFAVPEFVAALEEKFGKPPSLDAVDPSAADPGTPSTREKGI